MKSEPGRLVGLSGLGGIVGGLACFAILMTDTYLIGATPRYFTGYIPQLIFFFVILGGVVGCFSGCAIVMLTYLSRRRLGIWSRSILAILLSSLFIVFIQIALTTVSGTVLSIVLVGTILGLPSAILAGLVSGNENNTDLSSKNFEVDK
jgi:hypothetical protein